MAGVTLRALTKQFPGGVTAVDDLDLEIGDGEFFALLGPSGCGKTTLLRTIAGLEAATSGEVLIGDRDVTRLPPGDRDVAMVFQDYALYPHMTVVDNVAYPLKIRKVGRPERRTTAAAAAASLQIEELLERRPAQLSGGQQQRVALARAIAYQPSLFLFDEPLSNLDARLRLEARTFLKRLQKELGITTIYVTHDQAEALALADRMAVMEEGRIRQLDTPAEVYQRPASLFVAGFIGSVPMTLLEGQAQDGHLDVGGFALPIPAGAGPHLSLGEPIVLGFRPEYAELSTTERTGALRGEVSVVELLGTDHLVTVECGELVVQATARPAAQIGTRVWVTPDPHYALVYRAGDGQLAGSARIEGDATRAGVPGAAASDP